MLVGEWADPDGAGPALAPSAPPPPIAILPATIHHASPLAANLRPADRAEAEGVYDDIVGGFAWAIADSAEAWVAVSQNAASDDAAKWDIIAAWGVVDEGSLLAPVGRVWCMTTPLVERHRRHFARESRRITDHWRQRYWRLHNCVDARYAVSVRWLKWLGFHVGEPWPDADRGLLWQHFWWQADGSR